MEVLPVVATGSVEHPAVLFHCLDYVPYFHRSGPCDGPLVHQYAAVAGDCKRRSPQTSRTVTRQLRRQSQIEKMDPLETVALPAAIRADRKPNKPNPPKRVTTPPEVACRVV